MAGYASNFVSSNDSLALHQSFPYPTWIPATIQHSRYQNHIFNNFIIHGKRKPFGKKSMEPENYTVNASEICKGVNIRVQRIEEVISKAERLPLIETVSLFKISLGRIKDSYSHEMFFLILSLASSQSDALTLPADRAFFLSLRTASCQAGDSSVFSSLVKSPQIVSIRSSFWANVSCDRERSILSIVFPFLGESLSVKIKFNDINYYTFNS